MHPTGPNTGQARTLDTTAAAQATALRLSLFAATTPLCREPSFEGAGRCLKRGQRQHADGRLVSTRSRWCAFACMATAAARTMSKALLLHSGRAAAGVARHNPIPLRPPVGWRSAAVSRHSGGAACSARSTGLSGRLPIFPSRTASGGRVNELPCHCGGTAAPLRRRCSPKCDPPAPLAAAFPLPSAGAKRARPLPPSPSLRWSAPSQRGGRRPCAGQGYLPCKAITHISCRRGPSSSCRSRSSC